MVIREIRRRRSSHDVKRLMANASTHASKLETLAEFRRLQTIVPSIQKKDNVSRLDIILEAIKYIDDLQEQLMSRLSGSACQRVEAIRAMCAAAAASSSSAAPTASVSSSASSVGSASSDDDLSEDEDAEAAAQL